jgi:hypothetical protein
MLTKGYAPPRMLQRRSQVVPEGFRGQEKSTRTGPRRNRASLTLALSLTKPWRIMVAIRAIETFLMLALALAGVSWRPSLSVTASRAVQAPPGVTI